MPSAIEVVASAIWLSFDEFDLPVDPEAVLGEFAPDVSLLLVDDDRDTVEAFPPCEIGCGNRLPDPASPSSKRKCDACRLVSAPSLLVLGASLAPQGTQLVLTVTVGKEHGQGPPVGAKPNDVLVQLHTPLAEPMPQGGSIFGATTFANVRRIAIEVIGAGVFGQECSRCEPLPAD